MARWPISEMQMRALLALNGEYKSHGHRYCLTFKRIAKEAKIDRRMARLATRALVRKGFAEYMPGLFNEYSGLLAGSGHCLTRSGQELAVKIEQEIKNAR